MVPPIIHTVCLGVRATLGYRSVAHCSFLLLFILLKYAYSWLIAVACYCICSEAVPLSKDILHFLWCNCATQIVDCNAEAGWFRQSCVQVQDQVECLLDCLQQRDAYSFIRRAQ